MATFRSISKPWPPILLLTIVVSIVPGQSPPQAPAPLSVEGVVRMSQDGIAEEVIITRIRKNAKAFDLSTEEILELKKSGVSDNVTKFLLDPSQPYAPPAPPAANQPAAAAPPPKPAPPARKYPEDPYALKVPAEPGLYRFQQNAPVKIDIKMVLGEKSGGGLTKVLTKGKIIGYLVGPASRARVADVAPVFYVRLPEGSGIEELVLVVMDRKKDRRELDMGPPAPKPELKPDVMKQFDPLEVGPGLFRLTAGKLGKGEYLFFLIGSAEPAKGNYGKGYDFGVDLPAPAAKQKQ